MVTKLETAVCFGKIMITARPIRVRDFAELLSEIKYQAVDIPSQMLIQSQQQASNNQSGGDESLPERLDNTIGMKLEMEFNDIYNIVRNPHSLREHNFASRFALVTPDG